MADHEVNQDLIQEEPRFSENHEVETQGATEPVDTQPVVEPVAQVPPVDDDVEEEEEEEEEGEEDEEEEEEPASFNYRLALMQFGLQTLLVVQTVWSFLSQAASTSQTIGRGVIRSLQPPLYIFFKGSSYPYRMQDYSLTGPGVAPVDWYYNAETKRFVSSLVANTPNEYMTHHFEWLSGQIKYNDLVLYDITDYLQQARWAGTVRPSISHVLAAWSLHSGIVLNVVDGLTLQVIKSDGTEATLQCRA
jgi:hypothetical protein